VGNNFARGKQEKAAQKPEAQTASALTQRQKKRGNKKAQMLALKLG